MPGRAPALAALAFLACRQPAPALPEVRLFASVSGEGARAIASLAEFRRVARVVPVPGGPAEAEVAWFGEPSEAVEAAAQLAPGATPPQPEVATRWKDPAGRFAPLAARARLLLVSPRAKLSLAPRRLRDLADPRLAGQQALVPFGRGLGPATAAALALVHGDQRVLAFLELLARNRPRVVQSEGEVRLLVAGGEVGFGLVGSEEAATGAASAASLEVVYPDQEGSGCVILPTAVALTLRGRGSEASRRLAAWMAGPEAERLLVARVPGYLPLRGDVPVPLGVRPAENVRSLPLDWDRLLAARQRLEPRLAGWPSR